MARILIIDDDRLVGEATQTLLRASGHDVTVIQDGKLGIEAAKSGRFELAIVDLFMPDLDGLKVIETIRRSNPTIPMIAASGFMFGGECPEMPGFESMAADAGAAWAIYKPFRPKEVLQTIEQALRPAE
jgi:DNA-binding response OmpR family regulator